jgi:two-component system response regulator QseB
LRVLIVEDDLLLGAGLQVGLRQDGHAADWAQDAASAAHALQLEHFDLVVLDLGLPDRDGLSLLRDLRRDGIELPVLILTARDSLEDRVTGLDAGADDYLIKPFDLDELNARVRALIRRGQGRRTTVLEAGALALDTVRRQVTLAGRPLCLPPKEYALCEALIVEQGKVVSRERLLAALYGWQQGPDGNPLDVHIHHLRRKLGKRRILTVRGVGYRLVSLPSP